MKKGLFLLSLFCLLACTDNSKEKAKALLVEAQVSYEKGNYNEAKLLLDSIDNHFKNCIDARKAAQLLMYRINLAIEENTLAETEKMIEDIMPKINETTQKFFIFEKSEYDELGRYIFKGTEVEKNVMRSYIHAAVDEYGITQLISTYSGHSNINHSALRLIASDGSSITTSTIPYNDGSNYKYIIDGIRYESVTYKGEKDNGALAFIASHSEDKGLKAILIGEKKEVSVAISKTEREALAASYELGCILAEQLRYTQQNKVAAGKIKYLKEKILSKNTDK